MLSSQEYKMYTTILIFVDHLATSTFHILNSDKQYSFLCPAFALTRHLLMLINNPITQNCPFLLQVQLPSPSSPLQKKNYTKYDHSTLCLFSSYSRKIFLCKSFRERENNIKVAMTILKSD